MLILITTNLVKFALLWFDLHQSHSCIFFLLDGVSMCFGNLCQSRLLLQISFLRLLSLGVGQAQRVEVVKLIIDGCCTDRSWPVLLGHVQHGVFAIYLS